MKMAKSHVDLIKDVGHCELCGSKRSLEVHHIIPRCTTISNFDIDDSDNLIVLCGHCHAMLTPKNMLTKYGLERKRTKIKYAKLVEGFYKAIDDAEIDNVAEALDLFEFFFAPWMDNKKKMQMSKEYNIEPINNNCIYVEDKT